MQNSFLSGKLTVLADRVALTKAYKMWAGVWVLAKVCELADDGDVQLSGWYWHRIVS